MVCLTYAELAGDPPHMRYLVRRIRQRFPHCPILIGFWESDDAIPQDRSTLGVAGATVLVSSLHEAVQKCLDEARKVAEPEPGRDREGAAGVAEVASPKGQAVL
jgi:hypothetical protein